MDGGVTREKGAQLSRGPYKCGAHQKKEDEDKGGKKWSSKGNPYLPDALAGAFGGASWELVL